MKTNTFSKMSLRAFLKSRSEFLLLMGLLWGYGSLPAQPYAGRLGVEAPGDVFVDIVKMSYRWDKPDGAAGWTSLTATDVDADGWPTTDVRWIMDFRPIAEWVGTVDDPDVYRVDRSGVYKGSFTGQATLTPIEGTFTLSNQQYNSTTNTTTFDLTVSAPGPHHGLMIFSFTNTRRMSGSPTGSGIANFKLTRPSYAANSTQVFTNEFLNTLTSADFSTIRFMGVTNTNNNVEWGPSSTLLQSWNNRKKPPTLLKRILDPSTRKTAGPGNM
ncbi:MAG: hypothetical protein HC880_10405 [Bacteroidia bacterium]|nr:hypothetical protein [Bacteroidia bacterium]